MKYLTILTLLLSMPVFAQTKYPVPTPLPVTPAYIDTPHKKPNLSPAKMTYISPDKLFANDKEPSNDSLSKNGKPK